MKSSPTSSFNETRLPTVSAKDSLYVQGIHVTVVLSAIFAVSLLGYHGTLDGQSVVAVLGAAIGFAGANVSSVGSLAQAVNGKSVVTSQLLAEQGATARTAIVSAAAADSHTVEPSAPDSRGGG